MVKVYGGRDWSAATRDSSNFFGLLNAGKIFYDKSYLWLGTTAAIPGAKRPRTRASFLHLSVNPKIQKSSIFKSTHKNFKVLLKRFLLGSYDLPGFLDYWIIINLTRLWDQITGMGGLCSPISSNQSYQVSMQPRPWLERSDQEPRSNRVPWKR